MALSNTFAVRTPLPIVAGCLLAGVLMYALGSWQTDQLAEREGQRLGNALAAQLVETIRQPILHDDRVSLQVSVDQLVERTEVAGAAVYNPQEKRIAQSGNSGLLPVDHIASYREPLEIEGRVAAYAGIDINTAKLQAQYRAPLNWVMLVWLSASVAMIAMAVLGGRRLSQRLSFMYQRLPGEEIANGGEDELDKLSQRIEPLLTQSIDSDQQAPACQVATVALHCKNLERLEAQLSKDNLQRLLTQLDDDLEQITTLYHGQRRPGREQTLFVEFSGDADTGDHPLRALCSAHLLLQLAASHAQAMGMGLEMSAAVRLSASDTDSSLMGDFAREKRETEVTRLSRLGERDEILLDSATSLHPTLADSIASEEISESSDIRRVESFSPTHQSLLEKQLRYLIAQ